jgi:hypothetical protein
MINVEPLKEMLNPYQELDFIAKVAGKVAGHELDIEP